MQMKFTKLKINFKFLNFSFYSHANGFYMIENEIYHCSDEFYIENLNLKKVWKNLVFSHSTIPQPSSRPALPQKWPKKGLKVLITLRITWKRPEIYFFMFTKKNEIETISNLLQHFFINSKMFTFIFFKCLKLL